MNDLIRRQAAIEDAESWVAVDGYEKHLQKNVVEWLKEFPPAEHSTDCISRQEAIDAVCMEWCNVKHQDCKHPFDDEKDDYYWCDGCETVLCTLPYLPSVQPEKETPKRVLWTGWKGYRNTRYKCPNCKKPVKNDDVYCHRCGQKLMFPHVDWTPYVEGQKQELIVRWDDE